MMPARVSAELPHPLFCGSEHPQRPGFVCTIDPFHVGPHFHAGVYWSHVPTEPSIRRAARVNPDTIPQMKFMADRSCYFCGEPAAKLINDDIPTCGRHSK